MLRLTEKLVSLFSQRKRTIFFVLLFVLLGIFLTPKIASAAWYDFLIGAVTFIPMRMTALALSLLTALSALLADFGGLVLNWVLGPNFINWSYTNPATNPVVKIGLDITQPFVNMILVLVLVFIALATILRLAGYETKKLLPTFILVALLVNFAPVICGLIVDASNIVMHFFTSEITGAKQLISMLKSLGDTLVGSVHGWETFKATTNIKLVLTLTVFIVINLSLFLILLLFAVVFIVRYLAIWILVILSPLAFVSYILPATRSFWTKWWEQLIQWSIIGITMGFFLYLADQFTVLNPVVSAEGLGGAILPTLLPLVFLYLGFTVGLSTSAMGASSVINFTKKGGKWLGGQGWTGTKALATRAIGSEWAEKRGIKERLTNLGITPYPGKSFLGKAAMAIGTLGVVPAYWATKRGLGEASLRLVEDNRRAIAAAQGKYKGTTPATKVAAMNDLRAPAMNRIGALMQAKEERQYGEVKKLLGDNAKEKITQIGNSAIRIHPEAFKGIRDAHPHLASEMSKGMSANTLKEAGMDFSADDKKQYRTIETKIVAKVKTANVPQMDEDALYTKDSRRAIHQFWTGSQVSAAGQAFGKKFIDDFQKVAGNVTKKDPNWYKNNNPALDKYMKSSAAEGLGMGY